MVALTETIIALKMVVGRLLSFWESLFAGAMLVSGRVHSKALLNKNPLNGAAKDFNKACCKHVTQSPGLRDKNHTPHDVTPTRTKDGSNITRPLY